MRLETILDRKNISSSQVEELDAYLKEGNPLLANFGKLGRKTLSFLQMEESLSEEEYEESGSHALGRIQNELLLLDSREESLEWDDSIEIHSFGSKLREVEALAEKLLLHRFAPKDVLVFAPDIAEYAPMIRFVFDRYKIDYAIMGLEECSQNMFLTALQGLLALPEQRFEPRAVLHFFSHANVREKFGFSTEEINSLEAWCEMDFRAHHAARSGRSLCGASPISEQRSDREFREMDLLFRIA
jgi:exodeoxyribonuclease V gamma subunit